jgi:hypothetical protein
MDDGEVNANGMFNGNRGEDEGQEQDQEEYFDDAGDIGYLPADHVSNLLRYFNRYLALNDKAAKCPHQVTDRRARACRSSAQRERRRSPKG